MKAISILNHVIGPIMRGPSSSHTAGAYHIGRIARSLLGAPPSAAVIAFDAHGSYGKCYRPQGADLAFAAGLMGWPITDERFTHALEAADAEGLRITCAVCELEAADHPNTVDIEMSVDDGRRLHVRANSIGGGAVEFTQLADWPVHFTGDAYETAVEVQRGSEAQAQELLARDGTLTDRLDIRTREDLSLICARRRKPLDPEARSAMASLPGFRQMWASEPVCFVQSGAPLCASAGEMVSLARARHLSLGQVALEYESALLGLPQCEVLAEMLRRLEIMRRAVQRGLDLALTGMQLLEPSAGKIARAEAEGRLAIGGLHTRAAARALSVMHVNSSMGIVCAAPTGGSAGTLPAVIVTLTEEKNLSERQAAMALLAAGAVGVIVANRATFAAEVAGCQVEIGAAGAMAAAAVVEAAGGDAGQAADAAAIAFQNTMGSVCDLVQGMVEIPCHTRNAVAASSAFVCADLILGGYANPIPLDETIDAVYASGKTLPYELRCTALGGLAMTPSARSLKRLR